jgi:hypothetical protein
MQPWMLVISISALGMVFGFLGMRADILRRYRATKALSCPETGKDVRVRLDTRYAVLTTATLGTPKLAWHSVRSGRGDELAARVACGSRGISQSCISPPVRIAVARRQHRA